MQDKLNVFFQCDCIFTHELMDITIFLISLALLLIFNILFIMFSFYVYECIVSACMLHNGPRMSEECQIPLELELPTVISHYVVDGN